MSDNNGNNPKIPVACGCGQSFSASMPEGEFSNNVRTSAILFAHEKLIKCPNAKCRQAFVLVVTGGQVNWGAQAVPQEIVEQVEGSRILRPLDLITGGH